MRSDRSRRIRHSLAGYPSRITCSDGGPAMRSVFVIRPRDRKSASNRSIVLVTRKCDSEHAPTMLLRRIATLCAPGGGRPRPMAHRPAARWSPRRGGSHRPAAADAPPSGKPDAKPATSSTAPAAGRCASGTTTGRRRPGRAPRSDRSSSTSRGGIGTVRSSVFGSPGSSQSMSASTASMLPHPVAERFSARGLSITTSAMTDSTNASSAVPGPSSPPAGGAPQRFPVDEGQAAIVVRRHGRRRPRRARRSGRWARRHLLVRRTPAGPTQRGSEPWGGRANCRRARSRSAACGSVAARSGR